MKAELVRLAHRMLADHEASASWLQTGDHCFRRVPAPWVWPWKTPQELLGVLCWLAVRLLERHSWSAVDALHLLVRCLLARHSRTSPAQEPVC